MKQNVAVCPSCGKPNRIPASASGVPRCGQCHHALPWTVEAGDDDFAEVAERAVLPVVIDFWAVWCGPCRMVSPALDQLAEERAGKLKLVKVDVDKAPHLSARYGIQAVPTLMVMVRGEVVARQAGAVPAPALRSWLDAALLHSRTQSRP
jgi:thioredoxin 2